MWLDVIALVIFLAFAASGAIRGTVATAGKLVSLIGAYWLSLVLAPSLGAPLAESLSLPSLLGTALAGLIVFIAAFSILSAGAWALQIVERRHRDDHPRTPIDRLGGGALGVVRGGLIVVMVGWLALWVDGLRAAGATQALPSTGSSAVAKLTSGLVESGGRLLLGTDSAEGRVASWSSNATRSSGRSSPTGRLPPPSPAPASCRSRTTTRCATSSRTSA